MGSFFEKALFQECERWKGNRISILNLKLFSFILLKQVFFFFLGLYLRQMKVPRLRVESELQPSAYATAIATQHLSHVCDIHHSSWQCQISDSLGAARDRTIILMDASQISFHCATMGTPRKILNK